MNNTLIFISLIILFFSCNKSQNQIRISSDFERGSIGSLVEVQKNVFKGQTMHWIKKDKIGNQYYWFYFRMDNLPNEKITIHLDNMEGTYRCNLHEVYTEYTQPVLSYDQKNWERIEDVEYIKESHNFSFSFKPDKSTVWLAYAHPYTLSQANALIDSISGNPGVSNEVIGKSAEGREIRMVTITNDLNMTVPKKVVVITTLQHPGEDCGGFVMEGISKTLLSENSEIETIKDDYIFKLVPVMNPDGLFHGVCRYNHSMEDLNSEWDDDISDTMNLPVEPEVASFKEWAKKWMAEGNKIDLFIDIHSNSQKYTRNNLWSADKKLEKLAENIYENCPLIFIEREFSGSAAAFFQDHYGIPSGTFEITQSYIIENPGIYLTPKNYMNYGKGILHGIDTFYKKIDNKQIEKK